MPKPPAAGAAARVFGFAGWSGSGKTTLITQLIPLFVARGLSVALIKHAHHEFDIDHPGKDSWRHRQAGAQQVLVSSTRRWALMHELIDEPEPTLAEHIAQLSPCDLILVEGFKREAIPKLEIHRADVGKPLLYPDDPHIIALATDITLVAPMRVLDINHPEAVAAFIVETLWS